MKRIAIIFFTLFYLLPAVGFSINVHWCGGKVASVAIEVIGNGKCACGKEMKKGCCKDIKTIVKLTDNQKNTTQLIAPQNNQVKHLSELSIITQQILYSQVTLLNCTNYHAPPSNCQNSVYLSNCVFRI
jgi:hypothetical protein